MKRWELVLALTPRAACAPGNPDKGDVGTALEAMLAFREVEATRPLL